MKHTWRHKNEGVALVMVLWVLMLLSIIALEFCYAMRTEVDICANQKDEIKGYFMARAGVERALLETLRSMYLQLKADEPDVPGDEEGETPESVAPAMESETEVWKVDGTPYKVPFHDGSFKVSIEDEGGKLDINYASEGMLRQLLSNIELPEVPSEEGNIVDIISDSVMDWRDEDDLHHLNGAEDDYYNSLPEPYDCKDGPFDAIEELLLVRGVTPEVYRQLSRHITIYSAGKINVNTTSLEILKTILQDDILAQAIVDQRKEEKLTTQDLVDLVGAITFSQIKDQITLHPQGFYTIKSTGQVEGSTVTRAVKAVVQLEGSTVNVVNWMDRWWEIENDRS